MQGAGSGRALVELFSALALRLAPRALVTPLERSAFEQGKPSPILSFRLRRTQDLAQLVAPLLAQGGALRSPPAQSAPSAWPEAEFSCPPVALAGLAGKDPLALLLLRVAQAALAPTLPVRIMGILNVTPDSFSDGGRYLDPGRALTHALEMVEQGAEILDIGGESSRPGAIPVPVEEELARVLPVVRAVCRAWPGIVSVDTRRGAVAERALEAGARWINDISAGQSDPELLSIVARWNADICLMHMQGEPENMQRAPHYGEVVAEVCEFLRERVQACLKAGVGLSRILLDPGIGFGKRLDHNLSLLRRLFELRSLSLPILVGVSRKSFLAQAEERELAQHGAGGTLSQGRSAENSNERLGGTAAAVAACVWSGAEVLRVHDVRIMAQAARIARSILIPNTPSSISPSS